MRIQNSNKGILILILGLGLQPHGLLADTQEANQPCLQCADVEQKLSIPLPEIPSQILQSEQDRYASAICTNKEPFYEVPTPNQEFNITGTKVKYRSVGVHPSFLKKQFALLNQANRILSQKLSTPKSVAFLFCSSFDAPQTLPGVESQIIGVQKYLPLNGKAGTSQGGLTANLHEYGHAVFNENLSRCSWRFNQQLNHKSRLNLLFGQLKNLHAECAHLEAPKSDCKRRVEAVEEEITQIKAASNDNIGNIINNYAEIFADMLTVFTQEDPKVMANTLLETLPEASWAPYAISPAGAKNYSRQTGINNYKSALTHNSNYRDALNKITTQKIEAFGLVGDITGPYNIGAPYRALTWRIYEKYRNRKQDKRAELLKGLMQASCKSLEATGTFGYKNAKEFNDRFLSFLKAEPLFKEEIK